MYLLSVCIFLSLLLSQKTKMLPHVRTLNVINIFSQMVRKSLIVFLFMLFIQAFQFGHHNKNLLGWKVCICFLLLSTSVVLIVVLYQNSVSAIEKAICY